MNIRGEFGGIEWTANIELPWAYVGWGKPTQHKMRLGHDISMADAEKKVRKEVPQILKEQGLLP